MINIFNSKFVKIAAILVAVFAVVAFAAPSATNAAACTFTRALTVGSTGADVQCLQQYLNGAGFTVATSGAGSPGNESMYFGTKSRAAVSAWQSANGVSPAAGYFGAISRAKYNDLMAMGSGTGTVTPSGLPQGCTSTAGWSPVTGVKCDSGNTTTTTGGALTVMAGTQPANSLAPQSASRVPFTTFTLTAGASAVHVNNVTVERRGLAQDAVFSGLVLVGADGIQLGTAKTLGSTHQAVLDANIDIPAGQSRTFTVAGNMNSSLTNYAGQVASVAVVSVNANGTVGGTLPIVGAAHTINASLTLGSITSLVVSSFDPNANVSKEVGTTAYRFAGIRFSAGSSEALRIWSIRWNQSGSVGSGDLANLVTVVNGTEYPTTVSSDGKYYTSSFGSGIVLDKGNAIDIYIKGDIVGSNAANRTIQFDVYKTTDLYATGEVYGYGITPGTSGTAPTTGTRTSSAFTTGNPWFQASTINVTGGSATTISKSTSVPAQNISVNVPAQPLGGFDADIKGEPISVQQMIFTIATSSVTGTAPGPLTNVAIYDQNGAIVAGPVDAVYSSANVDKVTFTDTVTFPVGKHTYTLKGKVSSSAPNGVVYTLTTDPTNNWSNITGQVTGNNITLSNVSFPMNAMTVRSAALAISNSATPSAQNIVAGGQQRLFANFQFDASQSGEDIRFSSVPAALYFGGGAAVTELTSCQLWDGATALNTSTVVNPSGATGASQSFTFDNALTVTKGSVKTLALKCNVSGNATNNGTWQWAIYGTTTPSSNTFTPTGVTSGTTVTETITGGLGQMMTVTSGTLTSATDAAAPGYTIAAANATGVTAGVVRMRATNEGVNLQKMSLILTNTASSSASDLVQVSIWDGATRVGTAVFVGTSRYATSTLDTMVSLPKDTDKTLTIKLDLANVGTSQPGTDGHLIAVDVNGNDSTGTQGPGTESGAMRNSTGSTAFSGIRLFKSYPTLALGTGLNSSGVTDGRLMRFTVTANSAGSIGIEKFTLTLATSSANVTNVNIFGFSDSAYSQPISGVNSGGQLMTSNLCSSGCTSGNPTLSVYPQTTAAASTTVQVPAGETRYFEVRGTVSAASGATNWNVTTTLGGDTAFPSLAASTFTANALTIDAAGGGGAGNAGGKFIWSTNATTTASTDGNNWTNGFGLPGLPSNGLIQTRTN